MKKGVKQKLRDYFIVLNIICGGTIFAIYSGNGFPYFSSTTLGSSQKSGEGIHLFDKSQEANLTKILFWTSLFGDYKFEALNIDQEIFGRCPVKCQMTFDKRLFGLSDGVVFHARDINSYTVFPDFHPPSQVWIFLNLESPKHTYLDLKNYANVFNWTMTYRRDSDIYHPYGRFTRIEQINKRKIYEKRNIILRELSGNNSSTNTNNLISYNNGDELFAENQMYHKSHPSRKDRVKSYANSAESANWSEFAKRLVYKPKLVAWVVSNCITLSGREDYVFELQAYLTVDVYGKCGQLVCPGNSSLECFPFLGKFYKFYLSFENSLCVDYVTEKFYDILRYDIVPVVYGGSNYSDIAPFKSFIDAREFASPKELAKYLLYLDKNPEEYLKYFAWKKMYKVEGGNGWCSLCMKLNERSSEKNNDIDNAKWYSDIYNWWNYVPIPYLGAKSISTSTIHADFKNNLHTSLISSSVSQFPLPSKDKQYDVNSLKASSVGLTDNEPLPQQSVCSIAPMFPTESWLSQVWKYITVK